jgi:hypothetical protein
MSKTLTITMQDGKYYTHNIMPSVDPIFIDRHIRDIFRNGVYIQDNDTYYSPYNIKHIVIEV